VFLTYIRITNFYILFSLLYSKLLIKRELCNQWLSSL
jgi:hypothetical protein